MKAVLVAVMTENIMCAFTKLETGNCSHFSKVEFSWPTQHHTGRSIIRSPNFKERKEKLAAAGRVPLFRLETGSCAKQSEEKYTKMKKH